MTHCYQVSVIRRSPRVRNENNMALFEYCCPGCNRVTLLAPDGACQNVLGNGQTCGYMFPLKSGAGNSKVRGKARKHTTAPPSGYTGDYSWVDESGSYPLYQLEAARSDSVHLDPADGYLFLFNAPSGQDPIAKVMYATGIDVQAASGIVLPLNSQLQNMHVHFDNYRSHFIPVADGTGLIIQQPNPAHPTEFHVISGTTVIFEYDYVANTYRRP